MDPAFLPTMHLLEAAIVIVLLVEFLYSLSIADGVYSLSGTFNNVIHGCLLLFVSSQVDHYYFGDFFIKHATAASLSETWSAPSLILCFLVLDFLYYISHMLKHSFGFLWMFHSVHHSDWNFNMSTFFRASFIERIFLIPLTLLVVFFLGFSIQEIALVAFFEYIYQFYCHSNYCRIPKFLEWLLITPRTHKFHHDQAEKHQRSNLGSVFSIWDHFFGTYVPDVKQSITGVKGHNQVNFIRMETEPIAMYIQSFKTRP